MKPAPTDSRGRALQGATEPARSPRRTPTSEPRTGVVRRIAPTDRSDMHHASSQSGISPRRASRAKVKSEAPAPQRRDWRCLEWPTTPSQRPAGAAPEISIAQLAKGGVQRQSGPAEWLPEAADFVHRMASKVAAGLGFSRCRTLCLRASSSALSVTEASSSTIMSVTGPIRHMGNVLRRAGLE